MIDGGLTPGRGRGLFFFSKTSIPAVGPSQPRIEWVPGLSLEVNDL